jgi:antitoxin MazE
MDTHVSFATVQPKNGTVTIPAQVRRRFGLDKPGAQVEIVIRDGEIVLVPHIAVPVEEAWFWSKEWQAKEREADEDIAAGRWTDYETGEEFLASLEQPSDEPDEA